MELVLGACVSEEGLFQDVASRCIDLLSCLLQLGMHINVFYIIVILRSTYVLWTNHSGRVYNSLCILPNPRIQHKELFDLILQCG
jgi:hypothetical protein